MRLDFARTDTFIPVAWIVVKASATLVVANLWWLNTTTTTTITVSAIAPDMGGAAAHRVLAAFAMVAVLLETHADACVAAHVCARGVFADAEALAGALRLLLDVFVVNLLLRAAPHAELECLSPAATCWAWALFSGLLGLSDAFAADAMRSACIVCVFILAAATAATPCFAAEYRIASFAQIAARFCAYVLCVVGRCYVRAVRTENTHQHDKMYQRARLVPNVALFGWLFVASPHVLAVCGVVSACACAWAGFGSVAVLDECAGFRKTSGGDVVPLPVLALAPPSASPLSPPPPPHFAPAMQPVHLNDDLAERLRSIEESVPTGRRRAAAGMFG